MVRLMGTIYVLGVRKHFSMCPIDGRISNNLTGGYFVTEEAPIYRLFTKSLFALNRERHF